MALIGAHGGSDSSQLKFKALVSVLEQQQRRYERILRYVESVGNSRSGNLHGFHTHIVQEAREIVKEAGGTLLKMGRYREGSAAWQPHSHHIKGKWVVPVYDAENDSWSYPEE